MAYKFQLGSGSFSGSMRIGPVVSTGSIVATGSVTAGTSFILGSADLSETDLEQIDGITPGTAIGDKALVVDGNKDIGTIRNLTIDGTFSDGNYTFDTDGNVSGLGTVGCGAITTTGLLSSSAGAKIVGNSIFGGTLNVTGAITTTGLLSSSAGANFIGAMALGATLNVTGAIVGKSTISASSNMHANQLQIANTEASGSTISGSNAMMFIDGADGFLKGMTFQNYASQIAGSGLTATNGKLAASAGGGDSFTPAALAVSGTAAAGINYMTVTVSSSVGVNLPASPDTGDLVYIKVKDGLDPAASPPSVVSIVRQGSHTIDGLTSIDLESPYASVGLVYVASNDWRII